MNSFKLTIMNFRRNLKTYGLYLMAMVFSVATYYNFTSMRYNPQFLEVKNISMYIESTSMTASILMILFLVFFIMYSSNFFLNYRKKEIGLYGLMGVDNYKVAFIFALEGLLLGIMSLLIGLFLGLLFSKLFLMLLARAALLNMRIDFFISKKAILETIIAYSIILFISFLKGYLEIIRTNLIDLMNTLRKAEELPKVNYLKGFASLVTIGIAYYIAVNYGSYGFAVALFWSVILVILGTYWLFGSFMPMLVRLLVNRKKIQYRGTNIISISNIAFRIKDNYRTFAAVAVLITVCITSFGTVSSLKYFLAENHRIEVPYTISFISSEQEEIERVEEIIADSNRSIELRQQADFLIVPQSGVVVVNSSTFESLLTALNVRDRGKILARAGQLEDGVIYVERPGVLMDLVERKEVEVGDKVYEIKLQAKVPLFGNGLPYTAIVVNDREYEALRLKYEEKQFNGIILDNPEGIRDLTFRLAEVLTEESGLYTYFMAGAMMYDLVGIVYFLGGFSVPGLCFCNRQYYLLQDID
ncbi:MAG: FtsX-like permease family protein [Halanaerobiales bacterium]